jgi:hypothetical protein
MMMWVSIGARTALMVAVMVELQQLVASVRVSASKQHQSVLLNRISLVQTLGKGIIYL